MAKTSLDVDSLKEHVVRPLEALLGRVRTQDKNSPRTMDMDIIFLTKSYWIQFCTMPTVPFPCPSCYQKSAPENGSSLKDVALHLSSLSHVWVREDVSGYPFTTVFEEQQ
ncbi:hypothetical protein MASR2M48_21730 [Spirochaetota bacterium]